MKLALGTVQFGLSYGVANRRGQPSYDEIEQILTQASLAGIDTIDTAIAYGQSEMILGKIGLQGWHVVSKIPPLPQSITNIGQWIKDEVHSSLQRLRLKSLHALLLHRADDLLTDHGQDLASALITLKAEGYVDNLGYSIYSPQSLGTLTSILPPDVVQAPLNPIDQRLVQSGWLSRLANQGVAVHVRSIFLQGLLLMASSARPSYFDQWHDVLASWDTLVNRHGHDALATCLGFIKAHKDIDRVIVGVDNAGHLSTLLSSWATTSAMNPMDIPASCDDPLLIEPSRWKT